MEKNKLSRGKTYPPSIHQGSVITSSLPVSEFDFSRPRDASANVNFEANKPKYIKEAIINLLALQNITNQSKINTYIAENVPQYGILITSQEVETKKAEINDKIDEIGVKIDQIEDEDIPDEVAEAINILFTTFIGRANPPHEGHIMAMLQVILNALRRGGNALILLGSGPGRKQDSKNPISFDLKRDFITSKLIEELIKLQDQGEPCLQGINIPDLFTNGKIDIQEMGKQVEQQRGAFLDELKRRFFTNQLILLSNILFVGAKDDDGTKLGFFKKALEKGITMPDGTFIPIISEIQPLEPVATSSGEPMSATQARKDGWIGEKYFMDKYRHFYSIEGNPRDFLKEIFDAINIYKPPAPEVMEVMEETAAKKETKTSRTKRKLLESVNSDAGGSKRKRKTKRRKLTKRRKSRKHRKTKRRHYR